jgi:hypothetical protein
MLVADWLLLVMQMSKCALRLAQGLQVCVQHIGNAAAAANMASVG